MANPINSNFWSEKSLQVAHLLLFFLLGVFILNVRKYPYADDWAYVYPLYMNSKREFISWIFTQHVDHRIPIQKIIQFSLTQFSGYDFSVLIFFNLLVGLFTSLMLTATARLYRGYQHFGDLIIPLIILIPASGYSLWAFHLAFLSSIFCVSGAIYCWCKYDRSNHIAYFILALVFLFSCALCTMSGAIFSTVMTGGVLLSFLVQIWRRQPVNRLLLSLLVLVLVENALVWLLWQPSSAVKGGTSWVGMMQIFLNLLPSSMFTYSLQHLAWKILIIVGLLGLAAYALYLSVRSHRYTFSDLVLALGILANLAVILSVAVGRSAALGGWNDALVVHYGNLTGLLPILTWLLISKHFNPKLTLVLASATLVVFLAAYQANYQWRVEYTDTSISRNQLIYQAFNQQPDVEKLVAQFALDFTLSGTPIEQREAVRCITTLRSLNYPVYRLNPPPSAQ